MGDNRITDKNRLSLIRPDLAEEWSDKNLLNPTEVAINCDKRVWWKCKKCSFEWQAKITDRNLYKYTGKNGRVKISKFPSFCPCCASTIVKNKDLMSEWDYGRNTISPYYIGNKSVKVWWKCKTCNYEWEQWACHRIKGMDGGCPSCNSLQTKFPSVAKELSSKNDKHADEISYGTKDKYLWECSICKHEWKATVSSRTCGGNGCPKCSKIILKDGTIWDSKTEAYFYIQLVKSGKKFLYNGKYEGLSRSRYDFYLPDENRYIEVTAFHKKSGNVNYIKYLRNIVKKKIHVERNLGSNFEFVQMKLNKAQDEEIGLWV